MSSEHNHHDEHKSNDTFFEDSTIAIGFVYTIFALAVIISIYAMG